MTIKTYYIKKLQLVTNHEDNEIATALRNACIDDGKLISNIYFPIFVRHTAYEIPEVREICQIILDREVLERQAILQFGSTARTSKLNSLLCNKVFLTLERKEPARQANEPETIVRKRFPLWFPKYGNNAESVVFSLIQLKEITFQ